MLMIWGRGEMGGCGVVWLIEIIVDWCLWVFWVRLVFDMRFVFKGIWDVVLFVLIGVVWWMDVDIV